MSVVPLFGAITDIILHERREWNNPSQISILNTLISFVSVSWNLTLFSHDMNKNDAVLLRIWDFLISSHCNMI